MATDVAMPDSDAAEEEKMMYGHGALTEEELDEKYPHRPHNIHKTLPFHELITTLFNPLQENKKKPNTAAQARKRGGGQLSVQEKQRDIIDRFIGRWRQKVGNDFYPAMRLIIPEKDRDRPMYGLKEKALGKLLVKVVGINKNSEDAESLLNWKQPGQNKSKTAGDFPGRCYEVLAKRPVQVAYGKLTVAEVNQMLDTLAAASKEEDQEPVLRRFYNEMNPEELMWLIRMIMRAMKVGATERSLFYRWHPDAESLFNVSSSLRRVCWELYDPELRLNSEDASVTLMQSFQPQLAQWKVESTQIVVNKMRQTEDDKEFWIEEKLDGERMQLHMVEDDTVPGCKRFGFWSRKGKDYTYLYGNGFEDEDSALTRHLKSAFKTKVRNIILDGEMIEWNMEFDRGCGFGNLKTAANDSRRNPFTGANRPLFRVFDCLYLNDTPITNYTMRDRRKALSASIDPVYRRLEIHDYQVATTTEDIEAALHIVIADASEGLVVKNPRSKYVLNSRNDDWYKVKPEYMSEFGENLDCVIIGAYYGSGHRGGTHSSYMCGLRCEDETNPQKMFSFFKVGGGIIAADYAAIRNHTDGKWNKWDPKKPPTDWILLGGGDRQYERPDEWIKPEDSLVIEVKAASTGKTDQFAAGVTLRFPRFKKMRMDKHWQDSLTLKEFFELKYTAEKEKQDKQFQVDDERKQRRTNKRPKKKALIVAGADQSVQRPYAGPATKIFEGLTFWIMTESLPPNKKSVAELSQMVKANGGNMVLTDANHPDVICVADRRLVKVTSIIKASKHSMVRPSWLFDCIAQGEVDIGMERFLLPMEPDHMFYAMRQDEEMVKRNVDTYGDSYCRDITPGRLRKIFEAMKVVPDSTLDGPALLAQFESHNIDFSEIPGWLFRNQVIYFDEDTEEANGTTNPTPIVKDINSSVLCGMITFTGGRIVEDVHDEHITQVIVGEDQSRVRDIRRLLSTRPRIPRIVSEEWIRECWKEKTLIDEERFGVIT